MEEGTVIMTGLDWPVVQAALAQIMAPHAPRRRLVADYDVDNVSDKVLCILLSYIPYVRRVVWRET
jgi:UDP-N-acetylglucosamine 2-epimerase (non-hydrolysing)